MSALSPEIKQYRKSILAKLLKEHKFNLEQYRKSPEMHKAGLSGVIDGLRVAYDIVKETHP